MLDIIKSTVANQILTKGISYFLDLYLLDNPVLKSFYTQYYRNFTPDITGYTFIFFQPPDLSGFKDPGQVQWKIDEKDLPKMPGSVKEAVLGIVENLITGIQGDTDQTEHDEGSFNILQKELTRNIIYMAIDFTPPQTEVKNEQVSSRSGALTYASDVNSTESMSVTFLEKSPLTLYTYHLIWVEYIREILRGTIKPHEKYFNEIFDGKPSPYYGAIDYLSSFYVVKYFPDMKEISYIGKCIGLFPRILPSKQLIGTRNTNEICTIQLEYNCSAYREYIPSQPVVPNLIPRYAKTANNKLLNIRNNWIEDELNKLIKDNFQVFGFLSGLMDKIKG